MSLEILRNNKTILGEGLMLDHAMGMMGTSSRAMALRCWTLLILTLISEI